MAEDPPQQPANGRAASPGAPTISTHVLDTEAGTPAPGIQVTLYKLGEDDRPIRLTQAVVRHLGPHRGGGSEQGDDQRRAFRHGVCGSIPLNEAR